MNSAPQAFQFVAASYLVRIRAESAMTLAELASHLRACSDESIFYHTFQSLETHHYSTFSSDFAQWVQAALNDQELAERMATVDLRGVVSISDLREMLAGFVEEHLAANPTAGERKAFEPFHFCEAVEVTVPLDERATTQQELADGIRRQSLHTLHYHFIVSRLRLKLETNDFSQWIEHSLGLPDLAERMPESLLSNPEAGVAERDSEAFYFALKDSMWNRWRFGLCLCHADSRAVLTPPPWMRQRRALRGLYRILNPVHRLVTEVWPSGAVRQKIARWLSSPG